METTKITYYISFLSDWHIGSGLGSGANADNVVIKDKNKLPYIPGKTIKGLLKDALLDIHEMQSDLVRESTIDEIFGYQRGKRSYPGKAFFSNLSLDFNDQEWLNYNEQELENKGELSEKPMKSFLYRQFSAIKINDKGVTENGSLRTIECCIPLTLEGHISGEINQEQIDAIHKGFKMIRCLGAHRNRGLGRCKIEIKP